MLKVADSALFLYVTMGLQWRKTKVAKTKITDLPDKFNVSRVLQVQDDA